MKLFSRSRPEQHRTPGGRISTLYEDMSHQTHLLIAGCTGSGKSVVINGIIHSLLCQHTSGQAQLILIDPKRVELANWRNVPHCIKYASEPAEMVTAFRFALDIIERRYQEMQNRQERRYTGGHVYVVIDELADLLTGPQKRAILPLLQRIGQIGRAANVHMIAATQCPTAQVLSTQLRVNFDAMLGLRTRTAQDSRNLLSVNGCETLPPYGQGLYYCPGRGLQRVSLPMIPDAELDRVVDHWTDRRRYVALFRTIMSLNH